MRKTIFGMLVVSLMAIGVHAQVTLSEFSSTASFDVVGSWSGNISAGSDSGRSYLTFGGTAGDYGVLTSQFSAVPDLSTYSFVALTYRSEVGNQVTGLKFLLNDMDLNSSPTSLLLSDTGGAWRTVYASINTSEVWAALESWSLAGTAGFVDPTGPALRLSIDSVVLTSAVPEPATYAAVLGVLVLGVTGYRRFRWK